MGLTSFLHVSRPTSVSNVEHIEQSNHLLQLHRRFSVGLGVGLGLGLGVGVAAEVRVGGSLLLLFYFLNP